MIFEKKKRFCTAKLLAITSYINFSGIFKKHTAKPFFKYYSSDAFISKKAINHIHKRISIKNVKGAADKRNSSYLFKRTVILKTIK